MSGLAGIVLLIAAVYALTVGRFNAMSDHPGTAEEIAARLAPIGKVALAGAEGAAAPREVAAVERSPAADEGPGVAIYQKSCATCHATGVAGAPMLGDKVAWEPRFASGMDQMMHTAINGKGAMPPRGTCAACTQADLKLAIEYMLAQVGHGPAASVATSDAPSPPIQPAPVSEGMMGMSGMEGMPVP